ncbi:hypothetical protein [Enterovibrio norvegicus]|uniref:hypothetical protein n=1 Tax=Enterovibrio norvegicus TaxID=188144 RepID=UPI000C849719|nr:hypothetical protein [Enterovibrio norvegicus]PMH64510.1 hypothetical protein BCU62_15765 [Enterovibrio norvegicus]
MTYVSESDAKTIVRNFFASYQCTTTNLLRGTRAFWQKRGPNAKLTIEKRENLVQKKFPKYVRGIIARQVRANFTSTIAYMTVIDEIDDTRTGREIKSSTQRYKAREKSLANQSFNVFAVKKEDAEQLVLFMYKPVPTLELVTIGNVTKHCLERIIQRMGLQSVEQALTEILTALGPIECSYRELLGRERLSSNSSAIKRHIPTQNGALLVASGIENDDMSILSNNLVTWIHKRQFREGQEVRLDDFNFVQMVNYTLSNPDKENEIAQTRELVTRLTNECQINERVLVDIQGFTYDARKYLEALEKNEFLDFMIDFERDKPQ